MRLRHLLLCLSLGICAGVGHATELVGDWSQNEPSSESIPKRYAITQPIRSSGEDLDVTLGIEGLDSGETVDFFVFVSSRQGSDVCIYHVDEVAIDEQVFAVTSIAHAWDIRGIGTVPKSAREQLWQAFIKGREMRLSLGRSCTPSSRLDKDAGSYVFSLKGSRAAHEFVAAWKPSQVPGQAGTETPQTGNPVDYEDSGDTSGSVSAYVSAFGWFCVAVATIVLVAYAVHRFHSQTRDNGRPLGRARREPVLGSVAERDRALYWAAKNARAARPQATQQTGADKTLDN